MDLDSFFVLHPITSTPIHTSYNLYLVALSYFIASFASYVALDITERIRTEESFKSGSAWWLIVGAFTMGSGIWTMHFIGMLAFNMPMPMDYDPLLTALSLLIAVIASALAFYLIKAPHLHFYRVLIGGIFIGLGIVCMHYTGMAAMTNVKIRYYPSLFFLSILIAILASEAALWLMIKSSTRETRFQKQFKLGSALVMGFAVCGMHYTGMSAAVFDHEIHNEKLISHSVPILSPHTLSLYVAGTTGLILSIALTASRSWMKTLQAKNQKLLETEAILEQKSLELQKLNEHLTDLVKNLTSKEERIRMILAAAADSIIVMDEVGTIEICNRAAGLLIGRVEEEIVSQNISSFIMKPQHESKGKPQFIPLEALTKHSDVVHELMIMHKENRQIPIELTISKSLINNKVVYILVFRDITYRKQSEQKMAALNQELVATARRAGMADVATSVLHNIGNVLNSVNTSIQILLKRDREFKIERFIELAKVLDEHKANMNEFFKTHRAAQVLPQYLNQFAEYFENERIFIRNELDSLNNKISHIKNIVVMQQALSKGSSMIEEVEVHQLVEDAIAINAENIEKYGIALKREYAPIPTIFVDQVKIAQILVNLIKNAVETLMESKNKNKTITLRISQSTKDQYIENGSFSPDYIQIEVIDNGKGIPSEEITKIFSYGFTTKKDGHGFGLHASSLSAQEAGGSLKAYSQGIDLGATFVLTLPCRSLEKKELQIQDGKK